MNRETKHLLVSLAAGVVIMMLFGQFIWWAAGESMSNNIPLPYRLAGGAISGLWAGFCGFGFSRLVLIDDP